MISFIVTHWPTIVIFILTTFIISYLSWPDLGREQRARERAEEVEEASQIAFGGLLHTSETPIYTALSGTTSSSVPTPSLTLSALQRLRDNITSSPPTHPDLIVPLDQIRYGVDLAMTTTTDDIVEVFDSQGSFRIPVSQVRFYVQGREEGQYIPILREHVERILHPMLRGNGWGGSGGTSGVTNVRGTYTTQTSPYIGGDSFDNSYWGRVLVDLESYTHPSEGGLENPIVHEESPSNPLPAIPAPRVNAYNRLLNTDGLPIEAPRIDGQLIYNAPHRHGIIGGTSDVDRAFEAFELSVNSTFDGPRAQMGLPPIDDQPTIMTTDGRHREDDDEFSMEAWLKDGQELLTGEPPIDKPNPA